MKFNYLRLLGFSVLFITACNNKSTTNKVAPEGSNGSQRPVAAHLISIPGDFMLVGSCSQTISAKDMEIDSESSASSRKIAQILASQPDKKMSYCLKYFVGV